MMSEVELPEHFDDNAICTILRKGDTHKYKQYPLTCGLAVKLRTALIRVLKRSVLKAAERKALPTEDICLYSLVETFTSEKDFLRQHWPSPVVFHTVVLELAIKTINLSPLLQKELSLHPLGTPRYVVVTGIDASVNNGVGVEVVEVNGIKYPIRRPDVRNSNTGQPLRISIHFDKDFLIRVRQYHEANRRPEGTFESPVKSPMKTPFTCAPTITSPEQDEEYPPTGGDENDGDNYCSPDTAALISTLAELPKEVCARCKGRRQVYCGDCWGARMPLAQNVLPDRIELPFDVVLLLHWQETLHKCTGVHVGALCAEGTFSVIPWNKALVPTPPLAPAAAPCSSSGRSSGGSIDRNIKEHEGNIDTVVAATAGSAEESISNSKSSTCTQQLQQQQQQLHIPAPPPLREEWKSAVESLDHTRDVLLFPCEGAELAEHFPWRSAACATKSDGMGAESAPELPAEGGSDDNSNATSAVVASQDNFDALSTTRNGSMNSQQHRWRLVVLEANWSYGKTMAMQIRTHRESVGLPPLRCVQLTDITGQYWKFQTEGRAAVSTIEAIAHTAKAATAHATAAGAPVPGAGCLRMTAEVPAESNPAEVTPSKQALRVQDDMLLLLFQLQKYRVLKRIEDGGKVPRAVEVSGAGLGSWKELTDELNIL